MTKIQTTGSYDRKSGDFSISICPNDNHLFTLDGLSIDDMKELKSLVDILLESYEDERTREYNLREAEYYDKRAKLDLEYEKSQYYWDTDRNKSLNTSSYDYMIAAGYEMTADGFWIPPQKPDTIKKWVLPTNVDGSTGDIIVNLPDDLLEATNLNEGDYVEWISNDDGTYTMKKVTKPLPMEEC